MDQFVSNDVNHPWHMIIAPNKEVALDIVSGFPKDSNMIYAITLFQVPVILSDDLEAIEEASQNAESFFKESCLVVEPDETFPFNVYTPEHSTEEWLRLLDHYESDFDLSELADDTCGRYPILNQIFGENKVKLEEEPSEDEWDAIKLVWFLKNKKLLNRPISYPATLGSKTKLCVPNVPVKPHVNPWSGMSVKI